MNIPEARAKAADASFPTLVDDGRAFFKIRRMHARGGSNSTAEGKVAGGGGAVDVAAAARVNVSDAASITGLLSFSSMSVAFCGVVMLVDALIFWLLLSMCCVDVVDVSNTAVQDVLVFNKIAVPYDNFHLHETGMLASGWSWQGVRMK